MIKLLGFVVVGLLLQTFPTSSSGAEVNDQLLSFGPVPSRRAECGGTIKSDENTLSFPGIPGESLIGGETCVWTIHLESMRDFRFNFTQFDVNSDDSSCSSAGVRLYSLSNLVPPGELENELFCSGRPPRDTGFFLGGTVAALVVYSTSNSSDVGSGFTLTWRGASFDPFRTKHVSSFSTVESGVVSYPVDGSYEPNLVATWTVITEEGQKSDLLVEKVEVEECPNSDPCTCDALILYEVEERGVLGESVRFCANSSVSIERVGVANRFLLAFFSDFNESPERTGFSAKYLPTATATSTPPTTEPTTNPTTNQTTPFPTTPTTEPTTPSPETSRCGQVLSSSFGPISYRLESNYANFERCVWTLQNPRAIGYNIYITKYFVSDPNDGLLISSLRTRRGGSSYIDDSISNIRVNETNLAGFNVMGEVAILTFYSDSSGTSKGFEILYEAILGDFTEPRTSVIADSPTTIDFPDVPDATYGNNELSTFIYSPNFKFNSSGDYTNEAIYKKKRLEWGCFDWLSVFRFESTMKWAPNPDNFLICANVTQATYSHDDMLLFAFKSDQNEVATGFQLNFNTQSVSN